MKTIIDLINGEKLSPIQYAVLMTSIDKVAIDDEGNGHMPSVTSYFRDMAAYCDFSKCNNSVVDYLELSIKLNEYMSDEVISLDHVNERQLKDIRAIVKSNISELDYTGEWESYLFQDVTTLPNADSTIEELVKLVDTLVLDRSYKDHDRCEKVSLTDGFNHTPRLLVMSIVGRMSELFICKTGVNYTNVGEFQKSDYIHHIFEKDSFGPLSAGIHTVKGTIAYG